jgi:DNA-binding GntR family transcriptional regulator
VKNNNYIYEIDMNQARNISTLIADKLSEAIRQGVMKPGERLIQTDLATKFGVSRVAIRDALQNLVARGLAKSIPKNGIIVRELSVETIDNIYNVRCVLESYASKVACNFITVDDLYVIKESYNAFYEALKSKKKNLVEFDWQFHKSIYSKCQNEVLIEIIDILWSRLWQIRSLLELVKRDTSWFKNLIANSFSIHMKIIKAIEKKETDMVEKLVKEMIENAKEQILKEFVDVELDVK